MTALTAVCLGAGSVSRGLIAPLLTEAGYTVVFVDSREDLVRGLAEAQRYCVFSPGEKGEVAKTPVEGISAIHLMDSAALRRAVATADLITMSVGRWGIDEALSHLVAAFETRATPVDLIVAENIPRAVSHLSTRLAMSGLSPGRTVEVLNLVRASIDRICPFPSAEMLREDPYAVSTEEHFEFLVDRANVDSSKFQVPGVVAVDNIKAYAKRKLLVFNLAHAAVAYLSLLASPRVELMRDAAKIRSVRELAVLAATQSAAGILCEYPETFTPSQMADYVDHSFVRITDERLADRVSRVGRDIPRKLGRSERIIGAMMVAARHRQPFEAIAQVAQAAFRLRDEASIHGQGPSAGVERGVSSRDRARATFLSMSGLEITDPIERRIVETVWRTPPFEPLPSRSPRASG